ncbi:hypothetical protein ID866_12086 [Astraeus odoratus]|nr:hypothetical protein ID866_12086 [Astraeus odoratus]
MENKSTRECVCHADAVNQVGKFKQGAEDKEGLHIDSSKPSNHEDHAVVSNVVKTAKNNLENINQHVEQSEKSKDAPKRPKVKWHKANYHIGKVSLEEVDIYILHTVQRLEGTR